MKKFAYARVIQSHINLEYVESEKVKNSSGDELFKQLPRLDFIKCDVEGLEVPVFTSFMETLKIHQPQKMKKNAKIILLIKICLNCQRYFP